VKRKIPVSLGLHAEIEQCCVSPKFQAPLFMRDRGDMSPSNFGITQSLCEILICNIYNTCNITQRFSQPSVLVNEVLAYNFYSDMLLCCVADVLQHTSFYMKKRKKISKEVQVFFFRSM